MTRLGGQVGTGKSLKWPVGEGAEGNGRVTSAVFRTPFSIGYVEQAYSKGLVLPFADIRNQTGHYVLPSTQSIAAAAAQKPDITPTGFSIVNEPERAATPSAGTAGHWSTPASQPGHRAGPRRPPGLAHPRRTGLRRRDPLCPPAIPVRQLAHTMLGRVTGPRRKAIPGLKAPVRSGQPGQP